MASPKPREVAFTKEVRKYVEVTISASLDHIAAGDRTAIPFLIAAVTIMDRLYLTQRCKSVTTPPGPIEEPAGNSFYPDTLTKEAFEKYVSEHPDKKKELESPVTIVREDGRGGLIAFPYSEIYKEELTIVSGLLRSAAETVSNPAFHDFLLKKADAFLSNDYAISDIAWIGVIDSPIELTIGPYEEYDDKLLAIKRSFEGILGVVAPKATEELHKYQSLIRTFDEGLAAKFGSKVNGATNPVVVVDEIMAGGHSLRGFVPVAYNLPNDTAIRNTVGSKRVLLRNMMRAKFEHLTLPIAKSVLRPELVCMLSPEIHFLEILGHELSHGLGVYCKDGLKEIGPALEEAKADIFGILFFHFLADSGFFAREDVFAMTATRITEGVRQLRFGQDEAHGLGALVQFNWLVEHGALRIEGEQFALDDTKLRYVYEDLGNEFAKFAIPGDYIGAQAFAAQWGKKIDVLDPLLAKLKDIPVDVRPVYE